MRRPIAARDSAWAHAVARTLAGCGIAPNVVSIASVGFAGGAAACFVGAGQSESKWLVVGLFLLAAICVQLRLLCNLFDGMIAVEFKQASKLGPIFNDFPDRPADLLILVGCGFASGPLWLPALGWLAGALALLTAYVRVLGVAVGAKEHFVGPMAKPQRMAIVTVGSIAASIEAVLGRPHWALTLTLAIIILGCVVTVAKRLKLISQDLTGASNS